jgi:hypothetical protein
LIPSTINILANAGKLQANSTSADSLQITDW